MAYCFDCIGNGRRIMSKIKKKDLARGSRINPEQIWSSNLDGVATNLSSANTVNQEGLNQEQYEQGNGTFKIHWNIPWLGSKWTRYNGTEKPYIIPFCLLPFQEFLSPIGKLDEKTPSIIMTEFSYGFDTRGEPAFITDQDCGPGVAPAPVAPGASDQTWGAYLRRIAPYGPNFPGGGARAIAEEFSQMETNLNHGKLFYGFETRGDLKFSVMRKPMKYFRPDADNYPTEEVYNLVAPMAAFLSSDLRLNPHFEKDLNVNIDPYSSYCLGINLPELHDASAVDGDDTQDNLAIVNLNIVIKFKHRLVTRDVSQPGSILPNTRNPNFVPFHEAPMSDQLRKNNDTVTLISPAADTTIEADTADGVNTSLTDIDTKFRDKLRAGLDVSSNKPITEHLCQDAGYDVIAIPMWNNQHGNMFTMKHGIFGWGPYSVGAGQQWMPPPPGIPSDYAAFHSVGIGGATVDDAVLQNPFGVSTDLPYVSRAIVPIDYPFTIHHVILAANQYTADWVPGPDTSFANNMFMDAWDDGLGAGLVAQMDTVFVGNCPAVPMEITGTHYNDTTIVSHIGLGVGTGRRGTQYGYRQIGDWDNLRLNSVNNSNFMLDQFTMNYAAAPIHPNWKLHYLPMNAQAAAGAGNAPGLFSGADISYGVKATPANFNSIQDDPHFCGNSFLYRNTGNPPAAAPAVPNPINYVGTSRRQGEQGGAPTLKAAADQWLEVRWSTRLVDVADYSTTIPWNAVGPTSTNPTGMAPNRHTGELGKIIHGYGGHWMYLIIKKTTVSNANWKNTNLEGGL